MPRKFILVLLCVLWLGVHCPLRVASGHADYDHSDPAADAVLLVAPAQVRIWFTQELFRRQGVNQLEVYAATGQRVDLDDAAIDDDDRKLMRVSLAPALPSGRYTVRWQALSSEDGHEGQGEFTFTVGAAGPGTSVESTTTVTATTDLTLEHTVAATAPLTVTTPTSAPEPTMTTAPTPAPTAAATTAAPTSGLPCLGGAAPLLLVVGALFLPRRRWFGK